MTTLRDKSRKIVNSWKEGYTNRVKEALDNPATDLDRLTEIVFQGILDSIAPTDWALREARLVLEKDLYHGTREDSDLYLQIMYCAHKVVYQLQNGFSVVEGNGVPAFRTFLDALIAKRYDILEGDDPDPTLIPRTLLERAKKELVKTGYEIPDPFIQIGTAGRYKGISVKLETISDMGLIHFKAEDTNSFLSLFLIDGEDSQEDWERVLERASYRPPSELYSSCFTPERK